MEQLFSGKTALVTGASSGIGKATAIAFAKAGANVVAADVTDGSQTVTEIKTAGGKAIFIQCDISVESDVENLISKTLEAFGRLDVAFNNAGIEGESMLLQDFTASAFERTININLKGTFFCMKHELKVMLKQGNGAIVNCASIAGLVGFPAASAYVASKHAVVGMTKTAALENAKN